jgi:hypothetical protein
MGNTSAAAGLLGDHLGEHDRRRQLVTRRQVFDTHSVYVMHLEKEAGRSLRHLVTPSVHVSLDIERSYRREKLAVMIVSP